MDKSEELQTRKKLEQEINNLKNKLIEELKKNNDLIVLKDRAHEEQLRGLEKFYIDSLKWRIGNIFVSVLIRVLNFFKNPIKFFSTKSYRGSWESSAYIKTKQSQNSNGSISSDNDLNDPSHPADPKSGKLFSVKRIDDKPVIAGIFDEFTSACFQPECTLITFRPDNWRQKLEQQTPEAIFVESAWNGNQGSWQYKIAKYNRNMGDEVIDLVKWAQGYHIPTIFWNKEDPPNFDRFIDKAVLFDYVFTSDENCIQQYKKYIKHDRIYSLPFAAQPVIHNPVGETKRSGNVCFAGTYHADEYFDRQNDMEIILNPSLDYGLDIYDRNYGVVTPGSERFRFPDKYQPHIKGRLNYNEMVKAYHQYKVFLNVNSVKESPTMFSRRVFELLASGTPVISTYSKGITELLGDTVFITESEADTRKHLDLLLNNKIAWTKASVRGIRKVMESHTYDKRLAEVLHKAGVDYNPEPLPDIILIITINEEDNPERWVDNILKQTYEPKAVLLISAKELNKEAIEKLSLRLNSIEVLNVTYKKDDLAARIQEAAPADYYAFWNTMDWYGPDYLKDYALATKYSHAPCIGKSNYYVFEGGKIREENPGKQFIMAQSVPLSTLMLKSTILSSFNMKLINDLSSVYDLLLTQILSTDPLNFVKNDDRTLYPDEKLIKAYFI